MLERFTILEDIATPLVSLVNKNREWGGIFLAEFTSQGIELLKGEISEGREESVSWWKNIPREYLEKFFSDSSRFTLIATHAHNRPFGEVVQIIEPYWSANQKVAGNFERGSVIDNFYISKSESRGDSLVAIFLHEYFSLDYHLFVHPKFKSEGTIMTPDKVVLTAYKYDKSSIGRVSEIPCLIVPEEQLRH